MFPSISGFDPTERDNLCGHNAVYLDKSWILIGREESRGPDGNLTVLRRGPTSL